MDALLAELHERRASAAALAIARYLQDHEGARGGDAWRTPLVETWRAADVEALKHEALEEERRLHAWRDVADPELARAEGARWLQAVHDLEAARTGAMSRVSPDVADFLREVGEPADGIEIF